MTGDERRSARLLFGEELALGELDPAALDDDAVAEAVRAMPVPSWAARRLQARAIRRGGLTYAGDVAAPMLVARRAVLGARAGGPPRVLLRLDAFPQPGVAPEDLLAVHALLCGARVPYLVSVVAESLEMDGRIALRRMADEGVALGLRPAGRGDDADVVLDTAGAALRERALRADVLTPAPGRLRSGDWAAAAARYDVVCGGPEDVAALGFHRAPMWRGEAVWLPATPPLTGDPDAVLDAVAELAAQQAPLWVPVVLDAGALAADAGLTGRVATALAGLAREWDEFLAAVRASRG